MFTICAVLNLLCEYFMQEKFSWWHHWRTVCNYSVFCVTILADVCSTEYQRYVSV